MFDDMSNIVINKKIHISELSWDALADAIRSLESGPLKRPISTVSFALNYYFSELSPFAYKATNLVIHILNSFGLFVLANLLLQNTHDKTGNLLSIRLAYWTAAAAALLWAIHPLNLSSVLYIVQRMTSLSATFLIFGLIGYCLGRIRLIAGIRNGLIISVASLTGFGILSALSKENGILIFFYAMIIEVFVFRFSVNIGLRKHYKTSIISFYVAPIIVGILLSPIYATSVLKLDHYDMRQFDMAERLMTEARVIWFYLKLIAAPTPSALGLYHDYFPFSTSMTQPMSTLYSVVSLILLPVVAIILRNRAPIISFAIFWFLAGHSLESSVVPLELVHEHRNYVPMFGPVLATTYYLLYHARNPESLKLWSGLFVLIVLLFSAGTFARASVWSNEYRMKLTQLLDHPNSARANSDMAILLHNSRQLDKAENLFKKAAELDSDPPHQLMRLMQHLYVFYKPVPREYLETLEFCARNTPYSHVTIWQYEALMEQSRTIPEDNARIVEAFRLMISSNRVKLSREWVAKSYSILGENYLHMKKIDEAIESFGGAVENDAKPAYLLQLANAYHHADRFQESLATLKQIGGKTRLPEHLVNTYDRLHDDLEHDMDRNRK
ncbi:MAG: hypothetical protein OEZ10_02635 [Gammaproteobacteria bacterium]|nr:hypothetical protein [Gammaproteobacteria bacterium]